MAKHSKKGHSRFRDRCSQLVSACLPKIGCQGWTRTSTMRFNKPPCYFDTTWHFEELQVELALRQDFRLHRSV